MEFITEWPPPPSLETAPEPPCKEIDGYQDGKPSSKKCRFYQHCSNRKEMEENQRNGGLFSHMVQSSPTMKASTLLARWWKERVREEEEKKKGGGGEGRVGGKGGMEMIKSKNPNTLLFHLSRSNSAKDFLQRRIDYLSSIHDVSKSHDINLSLATCYHMLGSDLRHTRTAIRCAREAKETSSEGEDSGEIEWLIELLQRQEVVEEEKERKRKEIEKWPPERLKMPQCTQVERRSALSLSREEFYEKYAATHTPLIITDCVGHMTLHRPWTLDYIKGVLGDQKAPLKRVVPGSVEWAQLEEAGECRVSEFIDSLAHQQKDELRYLFDWSLPINSPQLMKELKIPEYFTENYLQKTPEGSLYRESWPSLFVAPAGITSELHIDAFGSNFWMALFQGRKRWIFYPPSDFPYLYPIYHDSTDATFSVDLSEEHDHTLISHFPLLSLTHPRECILCPGELLFVPSGSPHRVENLEMSLAISANFVDESNFSLAMEELRVNGLLDPRSLDLWTFFRSEEFSKQQHRIINSK